MHENKILNTEQVYNYIIENYNNKNPFSVIRIGDGEARILDYKVYEKTTLDLLYQSLMKWFGTIDFSDEDLLKLKNYLIKSCQNSDILGIHLNIQYDTWNSIERYFLPKYNLLGENNYLTQANVHINLQKEGYLEKIIKHIGVKNIITIAGRKINFIPIKNQILIPTQTKFNNDKNSILGNHYPTVFNNILLKIQKNAKGRFYLIGAGPLGKIYSYYIKKYGGMALDIGSIFDAWCNIKTRKYQTDWNDYKINL